MPGRITGFRVQYPDGWLSWDVGQGAARADQLVAPAPDGVRATLRDTVLRTESVMTAEGGVVSTGLWVPDLMTGDVHAVARLELRILDTARPCVRDAELAARRADPLRDFKVFDHAVEPVDLPGGPGLVEVSVLAPRTRGLLRRPAGSTVESRVTYWVYPPGSGDALQLELMATHPDLLEAVADQAGTIAQTVAAAVEDLA